MRIFHNIVDFINLILLVKTVLVSVISIVSKSTVVDFFLLRQVLNRDP